MPSGAPWMVLFAVVVFELPVENAHEASPSPELAPHEVIDAHLSALGTNDRPHAGAGVEVLWRFAAPALRARYGGLEALREAFQGPLQPLLGHLRALVERPRIAGDHSSALVVVTDARGRPVGFVFELRREREGPASGCWLVSRLERVDAPHPVGLPSPRLERRI